MKKQIQIVYVENDGKWEPQEFRLIKENNIFTFDKENIFTSSCDAYVLPNDGSYSILVVNKDMERFNQERKEEREKMFLL